MRAVVALGTGGRRAPGMQLDRLSSIHALGAVRFSIRTIELHQAVRTRLNVQDMSSSNGSGGGDRVARVLAGIC